MILAGEEVECAVEGRILEFATLEIIRVEVRCSEWRVSVPHAERPSHFAASVLGQIPS